MIPFSCTIMIKTDMELNYVVKQSNQSQPFHFYCSHHAFPFRNATFLDKVPQLSLFRQQLILPGPLVYFKHGWPEVYSSQPLHCQVQLACLIYTHTYIKVVHDETTLLLYYTQIHSHKHRQTQLREVTQVNLSILIQQCHRETHSLDEGHSVCEASLFSPPETMTTGFKRACLRNN